MITEENANENISVNASDEVNNKSVDYAEFPMESDELDDFEFEVYTELRRWRKTCYQKLDIEPYKIFQNRTLLEFIRRKRNENWAKPEISSDISEDLLQCWGIGSSKVQDGGFGYEMLNYFHANKLDATLKKSLELEASLKRCEPLLINAAESS